MAALCFRLLSQLNEKEREYQELLRNSVQRKQEQIDALRKAAVTEGNFLGFFNHTVCYTCVDSTRNLVLVPGEFDSVCIFWEHHLCRIMTVQVL